MLSVSGTTPSPANDASPWTTIGSTLVSLRASGAPPFTRWRARATPGDHRIHDLEMARIRHQLDVDRADAWHVARRHDSPCGTSRRRCRSRRSCRDDALELTEAACDTACPSRA